MKPNVIESMGEKLTISIGMYHNLRTAIELTCEDHEPFATFSSNIAEADLADDEFCVPTWKMPEELLNDMLASGKFADTGRTVATGHVIAPIWKIKCPDMLKAADDQRQKFKEMACGGQ